MQSERSSESMSTPSPDQKPAISSTSEMLTPSELEELQRQGRENLAYLQKVYPNVKIHR